MKNKKRTKKEPVFNNPLDIGLRVLFFLAETKRLFDLQSLVYLDYFLVHSGDIKNGPKSIHPSTQFRIGEILIKRKLMEEGLQLMHSKELLNIILNEQGVQYSRNNLTNFFITNYSQSDYAKELQIRAKWVNKKFSKFNDQKLKRYVEENLTKWGPEFVNNNKAST